MNMIAIDTHEVVQELKAAGFTEAQAEAVTRIVRKSQDIDLSSLATKNDLAVTKADLQRDMGELKLNLAEVKADLQRDLAELRADLQRDLAALRADLQRDLGNTKAEMLKWVIGSIGIQTIVILGAVIALTRTVPH
jgi:hypothetical protein